MASAFSAVQITLVALLVLLTVAVNGAPMEVPSDLSGNWSVLDNANRVATYTLVQKGNLLLWPSNRDPNVPFALNVTLFNDVGLGEGALVSVNDPNVFCSFTSVVVEVINIGFMKLTWFPQRATGNCNAYPGGYAFLTRPYSSP